jgi:hypothetical protein
MIRKDRIEKDPISPRKQLEKGSYPAPARTFQGEDGPP